MKPTGEGGGGVAEVEGTVAEGSSLLIVGVKPDEWSREVLTWSLVNVARPGDRIVALHVLDYALGLFKPSFSFRSELFFFITNFVLFLVVKKAQRHLFRWLGVLIQCLVFMKASAT